MKTRRLLTVLLALCLSISLFAASVSAAEVLYNGSFTDGASFVVYDDGTMVISGTGNVGVLWGRDRLGENVKQVVKKVIFEEGFTKALDQAFTRVIYMETLELPGSMVEIYQDAFFQNDALREVILKEGLQTIGKSSFSQCALEQITIPSTVTSIGDQAFAYNPVTQVTFLGGPPTFGDKVFVGGWDEAGDDLPLTIYYPDNAGWTQDHMIYQGRDAVYIPYTLDASGAMVPDESRAYTAVKPEGIYDSGTYESGATYVIYDDGTQVISGTGEVGYGWGAVGVAKKVIIEEGFTSTASRSIAMMTYMETLELPASMVEIGYDAFYGNYELKEVILKEGLQTIGESAFNGCYQVKQITIPSTVTSIGDEAFYGTGITQATFLGGPPAFGELLFLDGWDGSGNELPLTIYYPDNTGWTQDNMPYMGRTTTYVPYTLDDSGAMVPDESRAYTASFVTLTEGTFEAGGSWRIEDDILYIGGAFDIAPENSEYDKHWANIKGLVVEEGVRYFDYYFVGYEHLASVIFPDSLYSGCSFNSCDALEKVELGDNLHEMKQGMFFYCGALKEITVPASVYQVNEDALFSCWNLESVTFLGDAPAFRDGITISRGVGEVKVYYPADNATWTEEILQKSCGSTTVWTPYTLDASGNMVPQDDKARSVVGVLDSWSEYDGIVRTLYSDGLATAEGTGELDGLTYGSPWDQLTRIEIGEGITSVNIYVEVSHDETVTIQLPSTVTTIRKLLVNNVKELDLSHVTEIYPDYDGVSGINCPDLETVILGEGLTEIPEYTFYGTNLKSIVIPDSVTTIGKAAFGECRSLESVQLGTGLQTIDTWAFRYCEKLTEIEFPEGLQFIGSEAFYSCGFQKLVLPDNVGLGTAAFASCTELVSVDLSEGLAEIPANCFMDCGKLESIQIPDSVTYIDQFAFANCDSLKSLDLNNATFGLNALDADSIEHLVLPKTLTVINSLDFWSWTALKSVVIPAGQIHDQAFLVCENLESVTLGDGVTMIGSHAFSGSHKLKSIDLNCVSSLSADAFYGTGTDGEGLEHITFSKNLETIPDNFAQTNPNLKSVVIPEGVKEIGANAFSGTNLTSVVLPDSLTTIGYRAFWNCKELESVQFGSGLETIESEAFSYCEKLKEAVFQENLREIYMGAFYDCGIEKLEFAGGEIRLDCNSGNELETSDWPTFAMCVNLTSVTLPEGLEAVPERCFENCAKLESVVISDSVQTIGEGAFGYCDSLKTVQFGSGLETIGARAFYLDGKLESALMQDNVTTIGHEAFYMCSSLEDVRFSNTLEWMGDGAFAYSGIKEAILPETFWNLAYVPYPETIENPIGTFAYCENLSKVVLHSHPNLQEIPGNCFHDCSSLTSLEIPDSVLYLRDYAFDGAALTGTIILPENIREIGYSTFSHTNLSKVIFTGYGPEVIDDNVFYCNRHRINSYYPQKWENTYLNKPYANKNPWQMYTVDENGDYVLASDGFTEEWITKRLEEAKKLYPEGYNCDQYSVSVLNATGLEGYGSQAFAYALSDDLFQGLPAEAETDVSFADVKVGDILRVDNDSRAVVVTKKNSASVEVVQGDWNDKVHWGETLTKAQVEAADYRITRYGLKVLNDMSAVPEYEAQLRTLPTDTPTEEQVYERIISMKSSFPEGFPFSLEILYDLQADTSQTELSGIGWGCSSFGFMASDIAFGTAPVREITDIHIEDIMVGDLLHYDPDPEDIDSPYNHMVVVLEVYSDSLVVAEGNYGERVHWGRVFTKDEVESMISYYTRYPEGTEAPARTKAPAFREAPVLKATNVSSTGKIKLSWNAVDGAAKYKVYRATSKNGTYSLLKTTTGTSLTNTSAKAGKTYYYYVVAVDSSGNTSEKSNIVNRTCDLARPTVTLSNVASSGKIKISWTKVEGAVKYEVYRATSKNGTYTKLSTTTKTSITNTSAKAGKTYYYKVKAIAEKSAANSAYSSVKSRMCDLARPTASVARNSKGKPVVSWKAVTGAVKYKVYIYNSDGELIKTSTTTKLKLTHSSAVKGSTYTYRVVAVHSSSSANSAKSTAVKIKSK